MVRAIIVIAAAVFANVVILVLARSLFNAPATFSPFFYSAVIELTAAGVAGAVVVYVIMSFIPFFKNLRRDFTIVSIIALILSYIPDFTLPFSSDHDNIGATWPIVGVLLIMHTVAALIAVYGLVKKPSQQ
jgi:hypothetical protein